MTAQIRLDADLRFTVQPPAAGSGAASLIEGTVTANGSHIEVRSDGLASMSSRSSLAGVRQLARVLDTYGLTLAVSGPTGSVVTLGSVRRRLLHRVLTRSRFIQVDDWSTAFASWRRRDGHGTSVTDLLPPSTMLPVAPTFLRRARRVTSTHDPLGGGHPRLVFSLGPNPQLGAIRRVYYLGPGVTRIGSDAAADLRIAGVAPEQAEIRRDENDEYVVVPVSSAVPVTVNGAPAAGQVLRTGSRVRIGAETMIYWREESADHGRPFGGRMGGEFSRQQGQQVPRYRPPGAGH